jgi:hypothetical protein
MTAPPLSRAFRRAHARKEREAQALFDKAQRLAADAKPGRRLVSAECMTIVEALIDPTIGPSVLDAVEVAYGAYRGLGTGIMAECMTCCGTWSRDRSPALALKITNTRPDCMGVGLVCCHCAAADHAGLRALVMEAVRRDFTGPEGQEVPAAMIGPGGNA